jgi:hypothetical protein
MCYFLYYLGFHFKHLTQISFDFCTFIQQSTLQIEEHQRMVFSNHIIALL